MPTSCCAVNCTNRQNKNNNIRFYRIPTAPASQKNAWVKSLRRACLDNPTKEWVPKGHERVCSKHFISGAPSSDHRHPDYIPSVFDFPSKPPVPPSTLQRKTQRYDRAVNRVDPKNVVTEVVTEEISTGEVVAESEIQQNIDVHTLQHENVKLKKENDSLNIEVANLKAECLSLRAELKKHKISAENLSDKKCHFFTGVPTVQVLLFIVTLVSSYIKDLKSLPKTEQILLTLMKLRLGLKNADLAYRFGISPSTVSSIIQNCIPALAARLQFLIKWPNKEECIRNLPKKFRSKFSKCRVIIDCSEIFTERPYNLSARAKTWSNYKHHHTLKFLIGITPYGAVSFLSKCWGGRVSDKELTSRSGFYNFIEYGDQVMADRGFTISQELALKGATLVMPPFICGRKQLPGREVQSARHISSLRIHVERAIERMKNFQILKQTMLLSLAPQASNIVTICAALTNLMPKLVK